jgi:hypothetical protein
LRSSRHTRPRRPCNGSTNASGSLRRRGRPPAGSLSPSISRGSRSGTPTPWPSTSTR